MAKDELTQERARNIPHKNHSYALPKKSQKRMYWKECKTTEECKIEGKVWDCSKNLKVKTNCEMLLESEAYETWTKLIECPETRQMHKPTFSIIFLDDRQFSDNITGEVKKRWEEYLAMIRSIPAAA